MDIDDLAEAIRWQASHAEENGAACTARVIRAFQPVSKGSSQTGRRMANWPGLSLKDVNIGSVLIDATRIAVKYDIRIPSDWMIVFKAIFTIEGLGRQLDPDFDLLTVGNELVKTVVKERYSLSRMIDAVEAVYRTLVSR